MAKQRYSAEDIITKLREAEVLTKPGDDHRRGEPCFGDQRPDILPVAERVRGDAHRASPAVERVGTRECASEAPGGRPVAG